MIIYYISSTGDKVDFINDYPITNIDELYGNEFVVNDKGKISDYRTQGAVTKSISISVVGDWKEKINRLNEIVSNDTLIGTKGKLYINDYYLVCNVLAIQQSECNIFGYEPDCKLTIVADQYCWIKEERHLFLSTSTPTQLYRTKRYAYGYPYRYRSKVGVSYLYNRLPLPAHFKLIVYGPVTNPVVVINNHPYQVFTTLSENEYLVIDFAQEKTRTIKRYQDGDCYDEFNNRLRQPSVFEKIRTGKQSVNWSGDFAFDVILIDERSQPLWT